MPELNATAVINTLPQAVVGPAVTDNSGDSYRLILDTLPLDNPIVQLAFLAAVVIAVAKWALNNDNSILVERNADKGRQLADARVRIDALCERGDELNLIRTALQNDVIALAKDRTRLTAQLEDKKDRAAKAEVMVEGLTARLSKRDDKRAKRTLNRQLQQSQLQVANLRRLLMLPSKLRCHIEL